MVFSAGGGKGRGGGGLGGEGLTTAISKQNFLKNLQKKYIFDLFCSRNTYLALRYSE